MKTNSTQDPWPSIYRQWIWADQLRNCFHDALPDQHLDLSKDFTIEPYWMFMCLWYGLLFSILEALRESKVKVAEVQDEIAHLYTALRKYRNAVFHVQRGYWTEKWRKLILDDESANAIHRIHKQVGRFLLNKVANEDSQAQRH